MLQGKLEELLPDYKRYLINKNLSDKTIKQYVLLLEKFIEFLDDRYVNPPSIIENINEEHVLTFIDFKASQGASVHNQDTYFKFIKYFFEYLYYEKTMKNLILQNVPGFVVDRDKYDTQFGYFTIDRFENGNKKALFPISHKRGLTPGKSYQFLSSFKLVKHFIGALN